LNWFKLNVKEKEGERRYLSKVGILGGEALGEGK